MTNLEFSLSRVRSLVVGWLVSRLTFISLFPVILPDHRWLVGWSVGWLTFISLFPLTLPDHRWLVGWSVGWLTFISLFPVTLPDHRWLVGWSVWWQMGVWDRDVGGGHCRSSHPSRRQNKLHPRYYTQDHTRTGRGKAARGGIYEKMTTPWG